MKRFLFAILLACVPLLLLFLALWLFPGFADRFDAAIAAPLRAWMAAGAARVPFSIAVTTLCLTPFSFLLFVVMGIRSIGKEKRFYSFLAWTALGGATFLATFVGSYAPGYFRTPLSAQLSLSAAVDTAELSACAEWLSEMATEAAREGGNELPSEMPARVLDAYRKAASRYALTALGTPAVKILSDDRPLSLLGILGIYAFPYGEITLSGNSPGGLLTYTAAHEMAHSFGYAREAEADMVAFLALAESGDPALRYAAAVGMLDYVMPLLREYAPAEWRRLSRSIDPTARGELTASGLSYTGAGASVAGPEEGSLIGMLSAYRRRLFADGEGR